MNNPIAKFAFETTLIALCDAVVPAYSARLELKMKKSAKNNDL